MTPGTWGTWGWKGAGLVSKVGLEHLVRREDEGTHVDLNLPVVLAQLFLLLRRDVLVAEEDDAALRN